jgi:formamidopyrimidine-DNA glycosylase
MSLPSVKDIYELFKTGATIEAQEKIMELRTAALDAREETLELRKHIQQLEAELATKKQLVWEEPYYWLQVDAEKKDGPYCQVCHDVTHKFVRLQSQKAKGSWWCHGCKRSFHDSSFVAPPPDPPTRDRYFPGSRFR